MDVPDILYFFRLGGGERGMRGDRERWGGRFFVENQGGGGRLPGRGGGREPGGCLRGIGEGGAKYFLLRGRKSHQVAVVSQAMVC